MTTATLNRIAASSKYRDLVAEYPPRTIRNAKGLAQTQAVIERLMQIASPTPDQLEFLELLATLTENYEQQLYPTPTTTVAALLAHLVSERGQSQAEIARASGVGASTLSDVLAGRQSLSVENIRRLSSYFSVPPALFVNAT